MVNFKTFNHTNNRKYVVFVIMIYLSRKPCLLEKKGRIPNSLDKDSIKFSK